MSNKSRRWELGRKLLIDPNIQLTLVLYSCVLILLTVIFTAIISRLSSPSDLEASFLGMSATKAVLSGMAFVIFVTAIIANLEITNRIVGPIFRLRRHMDMISEGRKIEEIHFRDYDEFEELAASYNQVLLRLKKAERANAQHGEGGEELATNKPIAS